MGGPNSLESKSSAKLLVAGAGHDIGSNWQFYTSTEVVVAARAWPQERDGGHYFEKPGNASIGSKPSLSLPVDYSQVKSSSEVDGLAITMIRASPRRLTANYFF